METINIEDLFDPIEKRKMKKKFEEEFKLDPKELVKLKKTAREGGKGAEDARYILFVIGETYEAEKGFGEKMEEKANIWFERRMPGRQEEAWGKAIEEEKKRHWEQLKLSKENGRPTNFKEIENYLKKEENYLKSERHKLSLNILERKYFNNPEKLAELDADKKGNVDEFFKKYQREIEETKKESETLKSFSKIEQYNKDLSKIEQIKNASPESKKSRMKEREMLGRSGLLKKYNPGLYSAARRVNQLDQAKKISKAPALKRALLELGRPDLVFGPEKLVAYIERMDKEGLPVSKLSAEVWQCSKAIDALSDGQLFELATEGNPAAQEYLRKNVAENPWLLVGNKNIGGEYRRRRGTGVSKFVLKSAFTLNIDMVNKFFQGAQELMPPAKTEDDLKSDDTFEGWTKELLSKETGEDVLAWDDKAFKPELEENGKPKINPTFDLFTRYAHPGQLGLIPPNGTLAERRKPVITDLLIEHKKRYKDEMTQKYIGELEKIITGKEPENLEKAAREEAEKAKEEEKTANTEAKIRSLTKELAEAHKDINKLKIRIKRNKEITARDNILALSEFDKLSRILSPEMKTSFLYENLERISNLVVAAIPGLEKMEDPKPDDTFDPTIHETKSPYETDTTRKISKIIESGYKLDGEQIKPIEVELE